MNLLQIFNERNYRLFFAGQGLSFIGSWIQITTLNWLLYQLTDSALALGYLSAVMNLPMLVFLPLAGSLADRFDRRRFLMVLQVLFMCAALGLGIAVYFESLTIPIIVIIGCLQSILMAFDNPSRQAFIPSLIKNRDYLPAAISMNSVLFNTSRAIGPPIAGWVMAQIGPAPCFLLNAISYLFMMAALLLLRMNAAPQAIKARRHQGARDNLRFIFDAVPLRYLLSSYCVVSIASMSVYVLLPIWAHEVIGQGPQGLGWLMGGIGIGALTGALVVGTQRQAVRLWSLFRQAAVILGVALILLSMVHGMIPVLIGTVLLGMTYTAQGVAANTLLQLSIHDDHRAGVMAFYLLAALGSIPVGNLLGGWLAQWLGLHGAAFAGGVVVLTVTAFFWKTSSRISATFN